MTSESGRLLGERTLDGSWDGLQVAACHDAEIGDRVNVALRVPRSTFWVQGKGTVTRVSPGLREEDEAPSIGIALDEMHGLDRMLLAHALRKNPQVAPKRNADRDYARTVWRIIRGG